MDGEIVKVTSRTRFMTPEELSMQAVCKQLYRNQIFRGFYVERCFIQQIGDYRDVIALERGERELEKLLLKSAAQLQIFYQRIVPRMWIGISCTTSRQQQNQLETCILTELNDLAFGEYWFCIRTLRFRDEEVQYKIKMVRPVDSQESSRSRHSLSSISGRTLTDRTEPTVKENEKVDSANNSESYSNIGLSDFAALLSNWRESIKVTVYDFMANDVNKRNLVGVIRFLVLAIVGIVSGLVMGLRFIGIFAVRFLYELSRFTHTATPIVFKLIDFMNKLVGGFFILLTMVWKDLIVNRGKKPPLDENRPLPRLTYEPSRFEIRQRRSTHYNSISNFQ
ncbi:uncharacterized protein Dwil_GK11223 [Drosophila willistoni]|uniref:Uncharacterized protein n=1 Tax=Drosophila willistoni TaxID=7260 RepID=B4NB92_DROWI|nr:uncharacterized protein LOC6647080 [Drosophila willistoni]EDW81056.2 uncharacterized protein Dwil_GK11223 [Drosophila willistoni]